MTDGAARTSAQPLVSIIIPTLNEAATIRATLAALQPLRQQHCEVIVADAGSEDGTAAQAAGLADHLLLAPRGRARQMNAGAAVARGQWLLFLHADTRLPALLDEFFCTLSNTSCKWGFFAVRLSGRHGLLRIIEAAISVRSRLTSVATGDQALFIEALQFRQCGGYEDIPLMEDVAISKRLRALGAPLYWATAVVTSSRRWEQRGIIRTVLLMWWLRGSYCLGVSPQRLVARYYGKA